MNAAAMRGALVEALAELDEEARARAIGLLSAAERRELHESWFSWAREGQIAPPGDWRVWLIRAGRGFGKTRAGAEWVNQMAWEGGQAGDGEPLRIALVGHSEAEARRVMVEGTSGLLAVARARGQAIDWRPTVGEVRIGKTKSGEGAIAQIYSATNPESLRGPNNAFAWCDELAKWTGTGAWDNLMLTLRQGRCPQVLVTTTPRPTPLMRTILAIPGLEQTRGRTMDNAHLPESFVEAMVATYGASAFGRQEIDGELIEQREGALWTRALIERQRVAAITGTVRRVVIGVDPPVSRDGDACGIVAVALAGDGAGHQAFVIEDATVERASPVEWAAAVASCAERHRAECVVAEVNQGGQLVVDVLKAAAKTIRVKPVHASRGKSARAEPVATLYEDGRAWHVGGHGRLEDELCGLGVAGDYQGPTRSPDRADALVWAMTALMLEGGGEARVLGL